MSDLSDPQLAVLEHSRHSILAYLRTRFPLFLVGETSTDESTRDWQILLRLEEFLKNTGLAVRALRERDAFVPWCTHHMLKILDLEPVVPQPTAEAARMIGWAAMLRCRTLRRDFAGD